MPLCVSCINISTGSERDEERKRATVRLDIHHLFIQPDDNFPLPQQCCIRDNVCVCWLCMCVCGV